jgi:hypothetical protein
LNVKILVLSLAVILIINIPSSFSQEFDADSMGLQMPDISMNPISGPPGTEVTITVKNMPPVPQGLDPRIELFAYVPFVTALGDNVANNCNGEHCFPVYSFEEIADDKLVPKTIKFSLFSTDNPKATIQGGFQESVCDVRVNEKTIERYGTVCHTLDQPLGDYEIKFAWGIQGSDKFDIQKTMTFTVTEKGTAVVEGDVDNPSEALLDSFENGEITEEEFDSGMRELGYDDDAIRKSKALIGKLPHQEGDFAPEQQKEILDGIEKAEEQAKEEHQEAEIVEEISEDQVTGYLDQEEPAVQTLETDVKEVEVKVPSGCLIATAAHGTELAPQVQMLREIRGNVLGTNSGTAFMAGFNEFYYTFSPGVADLERQSPVFRETVKAIITPMLSTLSILQFADIDSESEMLGYGIGVILLNAGIYFVVPTIIILKIRSRLKN